MDDIRTSLVRSKVFFLLEENKNKSLCLLTQVVVSLVNGLRGVASGHWSKVSWFKTKTQKFQLLLLESMPCTYKFTVGVDSSLNVAWSHWGKECTLKKSPQRKANQASSFVSKVSREKPCLHCRSLCWWSIRTGSIVLCSSMPADTKGIKPLDCKQENHRDQVQKILRHSFHTLLDSADHLDTSDCPLTESLPRRWGLYVDILADGDIQS